jgi:hypothetical protein
MHVRIESPETRETVDTRHRTRTNKTINTLQRAKKKNSTGPTKIKTGDEHMCPQRVRSYCFL